jgi:DNA repair exonuclease SbcCD ATPase subunit
MTENIHLLSNGAISLPEARHSHNKMGISGRISNAYVGFRQNSVRVLNGDENGILLKIVKWAVRWAGRIAAVLLPPLGWLVLWDFTREEGRQKELKQIKLDRGGRSGGSSGNSKKVDALEEKIEALKNDNANLNAQIVGATEQIDKVQEKLDALKAARDQALEQVEHLQKNAAQREAQLHQLENKIAEDNLQLKNLDDTIKDCCAQIEHKQNRIHNNNEEIDALKAKIQNAENTIAHLNNTQKEVESKNAALQESLNQQQAEAEANINVLQNLQSTLTQISQEKTDLQEELKRVQDALPENTMNIAEKHEHMLQALHAKSKRIQELESQLEHLHTQQEEIVKQARNKERAQLKEKLTEFTNKTNENYAQYVEEHNADLETRKALNEEAFKRNIETIKNNAQAQIEAFKKEYDTTVDQYNELLKSYNHLMSTRNKNANIIQVEELDALKTEHKQLQLQLKEQNQAAVKTRLHYETIFDEQKREYDNHRIANQGKLVAQGKAFAKEQEKLQKEINDLKIRAEKADQLLHQALKLAQEQSKEIDHADSKLLSNKISNAEKDFENAKKSLADLQLQQKTLASLSRSISQEIRQSTLYFSQSFTNSEATSSVVDFANLFPNDPNDETVELSEEEEAELRERIKAAAGALHVSDSIIITEIKDSDEELNLPAIPPPPEPLHASQANYVEYLRDLKNKTNEIKLITQEMYQDVCNNYEKVKKELAAANETIKTLNEEIRVFNGNKKPEDVLVQEIKAPSIVLPPLPPPPPSPAKQNESKVKRVFVNNKPVLAPGQNKEEASSNILDQITSGAIKLRQVSILDQNKNNEPENGSEESMLNALSRAFVGRRDVMKAVDSDDESDDEDWLN